MDADALVRRWLAGRAQPQPDGSVALAPRAGVALVDKLRRAYRWIAERALVTPYDDVEFGAARLLGKGSTKVPTHQGEAWCSFVLFPLLTLVTKQRLLIVGGPGRIRGHRTMVHEPSMREAMNGKVKRRTPSVPWMGALPVGSVTRTMRRRR